MNILPMENPEGVGLVTAMAVSGGFILLSSLIDRTLSRLLNINATSSSDPSATFTKIIKRRSRRRAPSTNYTDGVHIDGPASRRSTSPVNSDHRRAADPVSDQLAAGNYLDAKDAHERVTGQGRSDNHQLFVHTTDHSDDVMTADHQHAVSTSQPSHEETTPPRRRFHVGRIRQHHRLHLVQDGVDEAADGVLISNVEAAAAAAEAAVAARYRHATNEPCSLVRKYLSGAAAVNQLQDQDQLGSERAGAEHGALHVTNRSSRRRAHNSSGRTATYSAEHEIVSAVTRPPSVTQRRPRSHNHTGGVQANNDDHKQRLAVTASKRHAESHRRRHTASSTTKDPCRQALQNQPTQSEEDDSYRRHYMVISSPPGAPGITTATAMPSNEQRHRLRNHHLLESRFSSSTSVRLMAGSGRKKVRFSPNTEDPMRGQRKYRCRHDMQVAAQEIGTDCEYHGQSINYSALAAPRYVSLAGQRRPP